MLTDDQVAGFLAVLLKTVRRMIKDSRLPHHWVLGSIFVSAADLDAFIAMSETT
ncbi:helix-turn-helix domain-containing protein [Skermanella pratensis]|uniref:helix-turn-helix domain-containing protein n=1 Tax=Skermanella pratensis TaxID=2233999 RepID=UPI0013013549|nr:helix-turn-helix domain-containing protein [Skermanella pratensis]